MPSGYPTIDRRHGPARRAALFGMATGMAFGLTAALVAAVGAAFRHGIVGVFTAWQTYLVMVVGPASFFMLQNALQAGRLVASQPALTLSNPVVAVAWGIGVFAEEVRGGLWLIAVFAGAGLVAVCTLWLSRSSLLHGEEGKEDKAPASRPHLTDPERSW